MTSTILITGASSGIGRSLAIQAAASGWKVGVCARDAGRCAAVVGEIRSAGGEAIACPADVGDSAASEGACAAVERAWGTVDAVVANAGSGGWNAIDRESDTHWQEMLRVHLSGAFFLFRSAYGRFRRQKRGHAIVVSSIAAAGDWHREIAYGTVKTGQVKLLLHLANQFTEDAKADGGAYHAHAVCPGGVATPFWKAVPGMQIDSVGGLKPEEVASLIHACLAKPEHTHETLAAEFSGPDREVGPLPPWADRQRIIRIVRRKPPKPA